MNESRRVAARSGGFIVLAALATHLHVLWGGWVRDDYALILHNPAVRQLASIPAQLSQPFLGLFWRPSVTVAYTLEHAVWGLQPAGFHATNLALHCVAALLVAALWRRFSKDVRVPLAAGLIFAVHGAHYQPAVIADRTGLMATTFSLAAWWCALRADEQGGRLARAMGWGAAAVAAYVVALGAKEEAVVLPVLMLAVELLRPRRESPVTGGRRPIAIAAIFLCIACTYLIVRGRILGGPGLMATALPGLDARIGSLPVWLLHHWRDAVAPFWLDVDYRGLVYPHVGAATVALSLALIVAAGVLAWRTRAARPEIALGLGWSLLAWLPTSNLVPVYPETADLHVFMPPHFLYFPNVALAGVLGSVGLMAMDRARGAGTVLCAGFLLAHAATTIRMNYLWMDDVRLYRYVLDMHPQHPLMWRNLGLALRNAGEHAEALQAFERSLALQPSVDAHLGMGEVHYDLGAFAEAETAFKRCAEFAPGEARCYIASARAHSGRGEWSAALESLDRGEAAGANATLLEQERRRILAASAQAGDGASQ